jgi:hypothetical protein
LPGSSVAQHYCRNWNKEDAVSKVAEGKSVLNCRITNEGRAILEALQGHYGAGVNVSQAHAIERALRDAARLNGIKVKGSGKK